MTLAVVNHLKGKQLLSNQKFSKMENFNNKRFRLAAILFPFQTENGRCSSYIDGLPCLTLHSKLVMMGGSVESG